MKYISYLDGEYRIFGSEEELRSWYDWDETERKEAVIYELGKKVVFQTERVLKPV